MFEKIESRKSLRFATMQGQINQTKPVDRDGKIDYPRKIVGQLEKDIDKELWLEKEAPERKKWSVRQKNRK